MVPFFSILALGTSCALKCFLYSTSRSWNSTRSTPRWVGRGWRVCAFRRGLKSLSPAGLKLESNDEERTGLDMLAYFIGRRPTNGKSAERYKPETGENEEGWSGFADRCTRIREGMYRIDQGCVVEAHQTSRYICSRYDPARIAIRAFLGHTPYTTSPVSTIPP